jgi:hypothetical protein
MRTGPEGEWMALAVFLLCLCERQWAVVACDVCMLMVEHHTTV